MYGEMPERGSHRVVEVRKLALEDSYSYRLENQP
jgi:hypothetical protein